MKARTSIEVAIAGTIINQYNQTPLKPDRRVLIFGKGPSLAAYGVPTWLADPQIQLFGGPGGSNDDWQTLDDDSGDGNALEEKLVEADFAPVCAVATDPVDNCWKESALWPTFAAGNSYTVHMSGAKGVTGIGLIEFYEK